MRKPSISQLVYNTLYPRPRSCDPTTFGAHIARNLVPEVRTETSNFYGNLDCVESQYPGLDYSFPPHRRRLSRFHYHRKLFRAFDELGLTEDEIASLCRWEGTRSAKERYERDQGVTIRDTVTDTISSETQRLAPSVQVHSWDDDLLSAESNHFTTPLQLHQPEDHALEEESNDDDMESYGAVLNERGCEGTNEGMALFEQWFKYTIERGNSESELLDAVREGRPIYGDFSVFSQVYSPPTSIPSSPGVQAYHSSTQQMSTTLSGGTLVSGMSPVPISPVRPVTPPDHSSGPSHNPARTTR